MRVTLYLILLVSVLGLDVSDRPRIILFGDSYV